MKDYSGKLKELLGRGEMLIHGTTHAINAIITGPMMAEMTGCPALV